MALDIFKKIETQKGLFAVEKISLIYNLLTSILILFMFPQMSHPLGMLWDRVIIALMTFCLIYLYRIAPCKFSAFVRIAVQMGLLSYWYPDTFEFNRLFTNLDHIFASTEQFIFGCQPAVEFSQHLPYEWVSEPLNLGYFSYYPMIATVAIYYFFKRFDLFEKWSFIIVTCFFIYYFIYIFVPVAGPQFYFPAIGADNVANGAFPELGNYFNTHHELLPGPDYQHGFFYSLVDASQQVGERPTAAFPSSHVAISTILMITAFRVSRKLGSFLVPFYLLLCCATVYIQAHYLIDSIMGFVSSFFIYMLVSKIYKKWFADPLFR